MVIGAEEIGGRDSFRFAMLVRYSFDQGVEADRLKTVIAAVLEQGLPHRRHRRARRRQGLDLRHGRCGARSARQLTRVTELAAINAAAC